MDTFHAYMHAHLKLYVQSACECVKFFEPLDMFSAWI